MFLTETLVQPVLSFDQRSGVYVDGETVTVTCNLHRVEAGFISFYQNYVELTADELLQKWNVGTFPVTGTRQAGMYQCSYGISVETRQFQSQPSEAVRLSVAGQ